MRLFDFTFDLDGVVADTHKAVKRAYHHAGVEMPDDAWGKPAHTWLMDAPRGAMQKKRWWYPEMVRLYAKKLPAAKVIPVLRDEGYSVAVVTNASFQSALTVLEWAKCDPNALLAGQKERDLEIIDPLVHVDDQHLDAKVVQLHYVKGMTKEDIYQTLTGQKWDK